jgi:hypothetical protein
MSGKWFRAAILRARKKRMGKIGRFLNLKVRMDVLL